MQTTRRVVLPLFMTLVVIVLASAAQPWFCELYFWHGRRDIR